MKQQNSHPAKWAYRLRNFIYGIITVFIASMMGSLIGATICIIVFGIQTEEQIYENGLKYALIMASTALIINSLIFGSIIGVIEYRIKQLKNTAPKWLIFYIAKYTIICAVIFAIVTFLYGEFVPVIIAPAITFQQDLFTLAANSEFKRYLLIFYGLLYLVNGIVMGYVVSNMRYRIDTILYNAQRVSDS